jgi:hypothetical protein
MGLPDGRTQKRIAERTKAEKGCGGTRGCRRWHARRVTMRALLCPSGRELLPVTWLGNPVSGLASRGCSVFVRGPWGLIRRVPLGGPWSRGPLSPLYCTGGGSGSPGYSSLLLTSISNQYLHRSIGGMADVVTVTANARWVFASAIRTRPDLPLRRRCLLRRT